MDKPEILIMLKKAMVCWPSYRVEDLKFTIDTYHEFLAGHEVAEVSAAMNSFARSKAKFMPSLPEILSAVERLGQPSDIEALAQARRWWRYLDQAQFANGSGYAPVCPQDVHPEVQRVVRAVGLSEGWETRFGFAWRDR